MKLEALAVLVSTTPWPTLFSTILYSAPVFRILASAEVVSLIWSRGLLFS